jgi:hypothetical protein
MASNHGGVRPRFGRPLKLFDCVSIFRSVGFRVPVAALAATAFALCGPSAAGADKSLSQNWAGYAAHGTTFEGVSARWRQPRPVCTPQKVRYSAMWVGLGGYSLTSNALEQIGTELDCNQRGRIVSNAWYELVPNPSHTLALRVRPGDLLAASVAVVGQNVSLVLQNLTTKRSFQKTVAASFVDATSAEWILEAPSACIAGTSACRTLPLTNFRHATFAVTRAMTVGGQPQTISSPAWAHTRITLGPGGPQFVGNRRGEVPVGTARPSGLINNGSSFNIAYRQKYVPVRFGARIARSGPTYLRH